MRILITENQKKIILTENISEKFGGIIKQNVENLKKIVDEAKSQVGLNLQFLLTWGASIGGFMGPVEDFVNQKYPEISGLELNLILIGVIATYFIENKELLIKIKSKIKEKGLSQIFKNVLRKSDTLKTSFLAFIESLGVGVHRVSNILSYTFIIPLIPLIFKMVNEGFADTLNIKEFITRIVGFTGITLSGIIFKELLVKMINRFKK